MIEKNITSHRNSIMTLPAFNLEKPPSSSEERSLGLAVGSAALAGLHPFAALVDLRMPGGSDGEALRRLRQRFPNLPILVMSAYQDAFPHAASLPLFPKPFQTGKLLDALEKLWR